ncbi:hypothetical protein G6F57_012801 [Rhizopus arrhizus]|nr:hypothetical protein G6F57_012801 [Rhizopus arrhizus]
MAVRGLHRDDGDHGRRGQLAQRCQLGTLDVLHRHRDAGADPVLVVQRRGARIAGRQLQPPGRRLVPDGHGLVHLLRSEVLRRLLRRAVLHP